jgi:periplasmic divalent cation tolerance protein
MILIYTTCESKEQARKISQTLLQLKLCACTNILPMESHYLQEGKLEQTNEFGLLIKSKKENFKTIQQEIKKLHTYDTPCIIQLNVDGVDENYHTWLDKETQ